MLKQQVHIGFIELRKPCLNLYSQRWLQPRHNRERYFSPILLMQLDVEFAEGLINWRIRFLKILRFSALGIDESIFFLYSITEDGKGVYKEIMVKMEKRYITGLSCLITAALGNSCCK